MSFRKVKQEDFLFINFTAVTLIVNRKIIFSTFFVSRSITSKKISASTHQQPSSTRSSCAKFSHVHARNFSRGFEERKLPSERWSRILQSALGAGDRGKTRMLYTFTIAIFGFTFAARISESLIERNLFERAELTKIGTGYLLVVIFLALSLPKTHFSVWIAIFAPIVALSAALFALLRRRSRRFRESFVEVLALIALKMKSGRSFRQSFSEVSAESSSVIRAKLSEIGSVVVFSQQKKILTGDGFIAEVIDELTRIDQQPHAATRRLANFREKLRIEDDFRRRAGLVVARIRAQSLIMTGLYLALTAFIAWHFGWRKYLPLYAGSAFLFTIGAFWIWLGGRNHKWKV